MDGELILLAKAGSEEAFELLVQKSWRKIVPKLKSKYYKDISIEDLEDVFQQAMLKFIENPLLVNAITDIQFCKWIEVICERKILDILKSHYNKKKQPLFTTSNEGEEIELELEDSFNIENEIIENNIREQINAVLGKLDEVDRIIICSYIDGYPLLEIADSVDMTYDNVRKRKSRIVNRYRNELKEILNR